MFSLRSPNLVAARTTAAACGSACGLHTDYDSWALGSVYGVYNGLVEFFFQVLVVDELESVYLLLEVFLSLLVEAHHVCWPRTGVARQEYPDRLLALLVCDYRFHGFDCFGRDRNHGSDLV